MIDHQAFFHLPIKINGAQPFFPSTKSLKCFSENFTVTKVKTGGFMDLGTVWHLFKGMIVNFGWTAPLF